MPEITGFLPETKVPFPMEGLQGAAAGRKEETQEEKRRNKRRSRRADRPASGKEVLPVQVLGTEQTGSDQIQTRRSGSGLDLQIWIVV